MIKYLFANPSVEILLKLRRMILHSSSGYQPKANIRFAAEQYRLTVLSALAGTSTAAQYNYAHFTRTMAKMMQKYANKIN